MQFSTLAIFAAAATAVSAWSNSTVSYTTEIVTKIETYCPAATSITVGGSTYTVTEATTLTITDCPCTIVKPVTTSSVVYCNTCAVPSSAPIYANTTTPAATTAASTPGGSVGTSSASTSAAASASPSPITASSGNKAAAISGASLAGLLGFVAYFL